jgi:hypothetical protein
MNISNEGVTPIVSFNKPLSENSAGFFNNFNNNG